MLNPRRSRFFLTRGERGFPVHAAGKKGGELSIEGENRFFKKGNPGAEGKDYSCHL